MKIESFVTDGRYHCYKCKMHTNCYCHEFKWSRTKWIVQICVIVKKKRWSRWQLRRKIPTTMDTKFDRKSLAQWVFFRGDCMYIVHRRKRKHMHIELNRCDSVILKHLQMLEIYRLMFRQVCRIEEVMNVIRISMEFVPIRWVTVCENRVCV